MWVEVFLNVIRKAVSAGELEFQIKAVEDFSKSKWTLLDIWNHSSSNFEDNAEQFLMEVNIKLKF